MTDIRLYAIFAGIMWGVWPLVMQRSGLSGFTSSAVFAGFALLFVLPLALAGGAIQQVQTTPGVWLGLVAGALGGLGLLAFNTMLAKVGSEDVSRMVLLMIMTQIAVPVAWHMVQSGDYSPRRIIGVVAAFTAAVLLS